MKKSINGCGLATMDNIRRVFSSFFAWLEDEDYIVKSPVRRIHRVKSTIAVKEAFSDENIEVLRDECKSIRELAIIELSLYKKSKGVEYKRNYYRKMDIQISKLGYYFKRTKNSLWR